MKFAFFLTGIAITIIFLAISNVCFAANPSFQNGFPINLNGSQIRFSSISLGDINGDGIDDIVVGDSDGKIHVYNGSGVKLWEYDTGDMEIGGKAAIGDINQDGFNEVVVGAGSTFTPASHGGLYVLDHLGNLLCTYATGDFNSDGWRDGVYASPSLADLDNNDSGKLEIVFTGWDGYVRVINHDCSLIWEKFVRDTIWSSPALGDIDKDGELEIVVGVDSHEEPAFGTLDGGILHAYNFDGTEVPGFPIQIDEVIYSSPALGDINGDGWLEIVVGTGACWSDPACAPTGVNPGVGQYLNVWDHNGNYLPGWPKALNDTYAFGSPALADIDSDGLLEVIINTADGYVHALNADATYVPGWPALVTTPTSPGNVAHFSTSASPIVSDINGDAALEIVLPSGWELVVWDKSGNQLSRDSFPFPATVLDLSSEHTIDGSAAVGDIDGDGDLEVVVGGARSGGSPAAIYAWDFSGCANSNSPWPAFRRDKLNHANILSGTSPPCPVIKANGSDGPITITTNDPLTIAVSLSSGSSAGQSVDWWVAANTSFAGWYYYHSSGVWLLAVSLDNLVVTYQRPLSDLSSFIVLDGATGLPPGTYTVYFAVDLTVDGTVNNPLYYDSVIVTVTQ